MSNNTTDRDSLLEALQTLNPPAPDQSAKQNAIQRATSEFQAHHQRKIHQGFWQRLRLIYSANSSNRRERMSYYKRMLIAAIPSASVIFITVSIMLAYYSSRDIDIAKIPERSTDHLPKEYLINEKLEESIPSTPQRSAKPSMAFTDTNANTAPPPFEAEKHALVEEVIVTGTSVPARTKEQLASANDNIQQPYYKDTGRDRFEDFDINTVKKVSEEPVSTFSIDVDTASYSFVRRQLNQGKLPQKDAVRIEEMINYFDYNYPSPKTKNQPFQPFVAISNSPWAQGRKLLHIGIKGYTIQSQEKPRSNLVFLLDVSGSMDSPDKLPLVKQSLQLLLAQLDPDDTIAIAVYAGAAGTVLEPTKIKDKQKILTALQHLNAGGSTAGSEGIRLAYQLAEANFDKNAINRIILATDGDFNVGITNRAELQGFIERKREKGIFLSVLGFGEGNYYDHMMQTLAQHGNGVAAYIDTLSEAQKVLVDQASSTLFPIANDVKIQLEFNPATVAEYRLIGYETRHLNREDFNNDAIDAGDIGAGHTVTALYEITLASSSAKLIDDNRYAPEKESGNNKAKTDTEYAFLKIRYKLPDSKQSALLTQPIGIHHDITRNKHPDWILQETGFATAVAAFAQLLKGGQYTGEYSYDDVIHLAQRTKGEDPYGYRTEFIQLIRKAKIADAM